MQDDLGWRRSWQRSYNEMFRSHFEAIIFNMVFFPLVAFVLTYLFVMTQEFWFLAAAVILFVMMFFYCLNYSAFAESQGYSRVGGAFSVMIVITLATIFLPGFGNPFLDGIVLFLISFSTVLLFTWRSGTDSRPSLSGSAILFVLLLPFVLAFVEALFLGFRFWETFPRSQWTYLFIPIMAIYGYVEEAIFRGGIQSSLSSVTDESMAIVLAALLNAAYMLIWGSIMFALFTFISATVMGLLYRRTRSLVYVGTIHALQDTWLILAMIMMGIII